VLKVLKQNLVMIKTASLLTKLLLKSNFNTLKLRAGFAGFFFEKIIYTSI